jgi:hypothetical protein
MRASCSFFLSDLDHFDVRDLAHPAGRRLPHIFVFGFARDLSHGERTDRAAVDSEA